jgi:hypothetical protein
MSESDTILVSGVVDFTPERRATSGTRVASGADYVERQQNFEIVVDEVLAELADIVSRRREGEEVYERSMLISLMPLKGQCGFVILPELLSTLSSLGIVLFVDSMS